MPRAPEALDDLVQQLERCQATVTDAIERLLADEITIRESPSHQGGAANGAPRIKMLSGFSFQPSLERSRIMALAALGFIDRHEVVHLIGQSGNGRSYLAIALGSKRCGRGAASTSPRSSISSTVVPR
jgi:predicted ribonuclease YlaK